jgi:hypothetical protein
MASKRPGQPTKYRPEYCELLEIHRSNGYSFETFGATLIPSVHRDTLYEWANKHPEFSDAKKKAKDLGQLYWEKILNIGTLGKIQGFNVAGCIYSMKVQFDLIEPDRADDSKDDIGLRGLLATAHAEYEKIKKSRK